MNPRVSIELLAHGILMIALGILADQLAPPTALPLVAVGWGTGGLSLLWGMAGLRGKQCEAPALLTLLLAICLFLSLSLLAWLDPNDGQKGVRAEAILAAVMLLASVAMWMILTNESRACSPEDNRPPAENHENKPMEGSAPKQSRWPGLSHWPTDQF